MSRFHSFGEFMTPEGAPKPGSFSDDELLRKRSESPTEKDLSTGEVVSGLVDEGKLDEFKAMLAERREQRTGIYYPRRLSDDEAEQLLINFGFNTTDGPVRVDHEPTSITPRNASRDEYIDRILDGAFEQLDIQDVDMEGEI